MIEEMLPTIWSQRIAKATLLGIPAFWFLLESIILPLMPYKLEANLLLTKILLSLALLCISLLCILASIVKSHNQLSANLKETNFDSFIKNPISG
jgi:hypothetical protein